MNIKRIELNKNQYYQEIQPKKIIVLHHTVSGVGVEGDIKWWNTTPEKIATAYIISRDGEIVQTFDDNKWAHHLGIKESTLKKYGSSVTNTRLNQLSIGIELDSWGGLEFKNGKYLAAGKIEIPKENVVTYSEGYRGFKHFEKYTDKQLASLKELLLFLTDKYQINKSYNDNMFTVNDKALKGYHGIWSHTSYREDKSDCHPQPELINMIKSLK